MILQSKTQPIISSTVTQHQKKLSKFTLPWGIILEYNLVIPVLQMVVLGLLRNSTMDGIMKILFIAMKSHTLF
jgi:hypothetical protein